MVISDKEAVELHCPACDKAWPAGAVHCPDDGTQLVRLPVEDDLLGCTLDGRFTVREKLGAGGMGAVYSAWQTSVGREVALKIIHRRYASEPQAARRFLREAKLSSRLSNPHTVSVLDFGQTQDGLLYLAMELLRGSTLAEVLKSEGPFAPERLVRVGSQLCDALEAAHRLHIVHRDLKPGNVILLDHPPGRDLVKVLDFGLAKSVSVEETHSTVSRAGAVMGTPAYMAPEQVLGHEAAVPADLYSLGVILYELASGRLPYDARTGHAMMMAHVHEAPRPMSGVPPVFESVILRLLRKEPSQRFPSAAMVREALAAAAEEVRSRPVISRLPVPGDEAEPISERTQTSPARAAVAAPSPSPSGAAVVAPSGSEVAAPSDSAAVARTSRRGKTWIAAGILAVGAAAALAVLATRRGTDEKAAAPSSLAPAPAALTADAGVAPEPAAAAAAPTTPPAASPERAPEPDAERAPEPDVEPIPAPAPPRTPKRHRARARRERASPPAAAAAPTPAAPTPTAPDAAPESRFIKPPVE